MTLTTRSLVAAILFGTLAVAHAGTTRDVANDDSYTGYEISDNAKAGEGVSTVRQYTWVCPLDTWRPADGKIEVQHSVNTCIDKKTRSLVTAPNSRLNGVFGPRTSANVTCLPTTAAGDDGATTSVPLGRLECFDTERVRVVAMVKEYDQGYFVAGGDPDLAPVEEGFKSDNKKAAAAAGAAVAGYYNSCYMNPFVLCSMPMPGRWSPLRGCWKKICRHSTNGPAR